MSKQVFFSVKKVNNIFTPNIVISSQNNVRKYCTKGHEQVWRVHGTTFADNMDVLYPTSFFLFWSLVHIAIWIMIFKKGFWWAYLFAFLISANVVGISCQNLRPLFTGKFKKNVGRIRIEKVHANLIQFQHIEAPGISSFILKHKMLHSPVHFEMPR